MPGTWQLTRFLPSPPPRKGERTRGRKRDSARSEKTETEKLFYLRFLVDGCTTVKSNVSSK